MLLPCPALFCPALPFCCQWLLCHHLASGYRLCENDAWIKSVFIILDVNAFSVTNVHDVVHMKFKSCGWFRSTVRQQTSFRQ